MPPVSFSVDGKRRSTAGVAQDAHPYPVDATPLFATSGNVANAAATATVPAIVGRTFYLLGYEILGTGATAAGTVEATLTGLSAVKREPLAVPAGATVKLPDVSRVYPVPLGANPATAVVLTVPALGAGSTRCVANIWGYYI